MTKGGDHSFSNNEIEHTIQKDVEKRQAELHDPDALFVQFLKKIQLYVQQENSPKSARGDYYYENLQFLRLKYQQFVSRLDNESSLRSQNYQPQPFSDTNTSIQTVKYRPNVSDSVRRKEMKVI